MKILRLVFPMGNNARFVLTALALTALAFTACERKSANREPTLPVNPTAELAMPVVQVTTFETVRLAATIDMYEKNPTMDNHSSVNLAFAKLDGEIAELQDRVVRATGSDRTEPTAKLNNLQRYRDSEMIRFTKAQDAVALNANPPVDSRSATQKMDDAAAIVEEKVVDGSKRVGRTLAKSARNTGDAIKETTH
jgi:hypothetical protein